MAIKKINFDLPKIFVQSMTNTKTHEISETLKQINDLANAGCDLVRVAIFDDADIQALPDIVKASPIPIVADIHFNYLYALKAISVGVAKIRLNPGNINNPKELEEIIRAAKQADIYIRIGVNCGSLPSEILLKYNNVICAAAMLETLDQYLAIFEQYDFKKLVISLKSSDPLLNIEVNTLAASRYPYYIHAGVTEAGPLMDAIIKSTIGLTPLLQKHIVKTIRISISDDPVLEIKTAYKILNALDINHDRVNIISCPTCGRLSYKMFTLVDQIDKYCADKFFPLKISILGCIVNGVGEGKHADIGVAGSATKALLFEKGKIIKTIDAIDAYSELTKLIDLYYAKFLAAKNSVH